MLSHPPGANDRVGVLDWEGQMIRILTIAAVCAATPLWADTYEGSGKGMGTSENKMMPIAEGHIVMQTLSNYESFDVSDEHPLKGASGPCFGSAEIKGSELSGGGICTYTTADGEKAVINWHMTNLGEGGAVEGDWTVSGGTGKWATASGGGKFSSLTDQETKKFVNTVSGNFTFQ